MNKMRTLMMYMAFIGFSLAFIERGLRAQEATGRWKGTWQSAESGHQGSLRANIRRMPDGDYRAVFYGRFAVVVPFIYSTKLQAVPGQPGRYASTKRLPLLGEYRMDATVTPREFNAYFSSGRDGGLFSMRRQ